MSYPPAMQRLVRELSRLPSIGEKSAARLAYHLLANDRQLAASLSKTIHEAVESIGLCERCFFLAESTLCTVCSDPSRDGSIICVVEKPMDVVAIERMQEYKGLYHVLHGVWAPMRGQGAENMRLNELTQRLDDGTIREAILATSSTVEGDATALYVARVLRERGVTCSRPAQGIPKGGELEYADDLTLSRAFKGRNVINL
ncbi:MAG: recombination protein RecR [Deltaproteobacteria bacterium]|nr:recombination protein RecR [Deltaproteobacteria bacterium]